MINVVPTSKGYKETFIKGNVTLRERRAVVEKMSRLIDDQKRILNAELEAFKPLRLSGWIENLAYLEELETALGRATPALLQPFDPLAGERDKTVSDDADLQEVYDTERHLLYVACTRARDHLLMSGVDPVSEFLDDLGDAKNMSVNR